MRPFDSYGNLASTTSTAEGALRRSTVRGAGATLFAGATTLVMQISGTVVLARLLTPTDFGLVAMVTTFSLLLVNFGFNGFTEAIVQREEVTHALAGNIFWINVTFGVLLTVLFASSGSLLAAFYHSPAVAHVAVGVALTIVITSISTVHLALLKRLMRFSAVSVNDIVARVVSVVVSILLAWMGWGYWALVAGAVAMPISTAVGAFVMCQWVPGFPRRVSGTRDTVRFALHTYGNFSVNYFSRNTDNLLVGWRFSAHELGFYKKAYDLFALAASQLTSTISVVVVAGLSRARKDPALYRRYLIDALGLTAFVGMGLGAALTLIGKDLILVLMGPKWGPAGQIFTYFGPGVGIMILYSTHGWIHLSVGRADRWFRWGIFEFIVTCLLFLLFLPYGPVGIATAWSVSFWVLTIPAIWYAGVPIELRITQVIASVWRYFVASLAVSLTAMFVMSRFPDLAALPGALGALIRMSVSLAIVTPLYLGVVVLLHGRATPLFQFAGLIKEMIQARRREPRSVSPAEPEPPSEPAGMDLASVPHESLPLVSILIPAYNAEDWIGDTIRSALAQTWPRIEIIVVDDGSKDATVQAARQFEPYGVQVFEQKNQGASAARNKAFSLCQGDYIQWLDADDLLAPDKIALQMEPVMQGLHPRTLLSSAWGHFKYRTYRAEFVPSSLWRDQTPLEWLLHKMDENVFMQTATWLVSRELTEAAGPWDLRLLGDDDGEYFCRVLLASNGVRFVRPSLVYYRAFRFGGLSYIGRFPEKIEAHWISMRLHIEYLRALADNPRVHAACMQYIRDALIYFYPERTDILSEANQLAHEFGQELGEPHASWKYAWVVWLFGWETAKHVQHRVRRVRWGMAKQIDYLLFCLGGRRSFLSAEVRPIASPERIESLAVRES